MTTAVCSSSSARKAQAGLSWTSILKKRPAYRAAFDRFDARKVARYDAPKIAALLANAGIVRNRFKIASTVTNAQAARRCGKNQRLRPLHLGIRGWPHGPEPLEPAGECPRAHGAMSKDLARRLKFGGSAFCQPYRPAPPYPGTMTAPNETSAGRPPGA
jgi:DNA-3-methyladenine glycosylase I